MQSVKRFFIFSDKTQLAKTVYTFSHTGYASEGEAVSSYL